MSEWKGPLPLPWVVASHRGMFPVPHEFSSTLLCPQGGWHVSRLLKSRVENGPLHLVRVGGVQHEQALGHLLPWSE